ncbi:MAG: type VI secretion system-associated protein TagF [Sandaracinaceae bacterium]|nr:type VI secretion system-associated protein TagF [Sandaracinaceae bacterium]
MPELGLFGKIPAKGDFVRHNVADDAARSFEQWVQESNDALRGADGELPAHAVRVVFTPPGSSQTVLALISPSQDQVGRKFPIVLFALTPSTMMPQQYAKLPFAWATFFDAAYHLAQRAATLDLEQLKAGLAILPLPGSIDEQRAYETCDRALSSPLVDELQDRVFDTSTGQHLYAYQTFITACQDAAKNDPGKAATVLDCPIRVDTDLFFWLELARRVFGFPPAHPSYFWVEDPAPRLLFSLGPAPLTTLQFLGKPKMEHQRLWPLRTERAAALSAAQGSLGPVLASIGSQTPLSALVDALAQRAASGTLR